MTIRVVIADDQQLVRAGFAALLDAMPDVEVVGQASDGIEAVDCVRDTQPDVVIMDIRMPRLDGIEATARLRQFEKPPAVIVVTTFDLDDFVYDALRAGAAGFLLKDTPPEALVAAVRVVAAGDALLAPSVTRRLIAEFARSAPTPRPAAPALDQLTDRERDVLVQVATGKSNVEIAEALYVSEATVKSHLGRVMSKLHLTSRAQAVVAAYESGLVTPGQVG